MTVDAGEAAVGDMAATDAARRVGAAHMAPLRVRPLTVVPEGDEFLVGDSESRTYVLIPLAGVEVIDLLRQGRSPAEAAAELAAAGIDVDAAEFVEQLVELGFVDAQGGVGPSEAPEQKPAHLSLERWLRVLRSPATGVVPAMSLIGVIAILAARPQLLPHASDVFFLATPAASLAILTVMALVLASAHECCHWLAARAVGVPAHVSLSRRLYLFTLETDLTALWGLPRRRRYGPLLAGIAFDTTVLFVLLASRAATVAGWWHPGRGTAALLAALSFVELSAIAAQFFVFLRTDLYAVFITATGCVNLLRVSRLLLRQRFALLRAEEAAELEGAHQRDLDVARWYLPVQAVGVVMAAGFFFTLFLPATLETVSWVGRTVASARAQTVTFWEALILGVVILSPQLLTAWVAGRDLRKRFSHRPITQ